MFLQACGGSDTEKSETPPAAQVFTPGTHPRFDPVVSDVPFNTDLVFAKAAATDGTADAGEAANPVIAGLNSLDGFSPSAYFDILIQGSVNPATANTGSVFLIQLNTGTADALNPANIVATEPIVGPASYNVGVVSLDGGTNNVIRIRPLLPLKSKTKYLVFITNDVKDSAGNALTPSWTYNALRDDDFASKGLGSLTPVRNAIEGWETLAGNFLSFVTNGALSVEAAKQKIILSYTFTTTDPQTPLLAMASPRAAIANLQIKAGKPASDAVNAALALDANGVLPSPKPRNLGIAAQTGLDFSVFSNQLAENVGKLYTGYIQLPYYQTAPDDLAVGEFLKRSWQPDLNLAAVLGITLPTDVDKTTYNLTYRFPFAKRTGFELVPLQVTMPEDSWVPGYAGSANCGQIYSATGYPLVIYVHGITSDRASVVALAHTLASRCIATAAIDLPMHGIPANSPFVNALNVERNGISALYGDDAPRERHFNIAGPGGAPAPMNFTNPTANDGSGAQFVNLGYFTNTRDNLRQGVVDLLNLNASLDNLNTELEAFLPTGINTNRIYVVGMSLGGIVSTNFVTTNQLVLAGEGQLSAVSEVVIPAVLKPISGMVLSASGTQVSQIMINSPTFGPTINAGLAAAGVAQGTSNYERFIYAIQSVVESGDPVSFAQQLNALPDAVRVPVLLQMVRDDQVVVNNIANAPLAGTEPMARLLGMTQLGLGDTPLGTSGNGIVKVNAGAHTSLVRPETSAPQITAEFQAQVVTFVLNNGTVSVGGGAPANIELPEQ